MRDEREAHNKSDKLNEKPTISNNIAFSCEKWRKILLQDIKILRVYNPI
jgi:hypothetical protein